MQVNIIETGNQFSLSNLVNRETELLIYCSRISLEKGGIERIKTLVKDNLDWDYLIQIANANQVMQMVYQNLRHICPHALPKDILNRLKSAYHAHALHNTYLLQELLKLHELLEKHSIQAVFFKGATLAASAYGNIELRQYQDIDVLVKENSFLTIADLLASHGYELGINVPWEIHLTKNEICSIDLHRYVVPQHLSCSLDADYIWNNLDSLTFDDRQIPVLSPEVELLTLCLNGTKEHWRSLHRICDVSALIYAHPLLNWAKIMQHANDNGFKRIIFLGVLLAHSLLETPLPPTVWQQLPSDSTIKLLFDQVCSNLCIANCDAVGEIERTIFHIRARERWQDKVQSSIGLFNHSGWMTPTQEDRDVFPLPKFLGFIYYVIRPFRILKKYGFNSLKYLLFSS